MSRNLVLLTVDSLRADHCGFLGSDPELTPALDELAANGIVYERAIAPGPRTPSSMPVAFTGEPMATIRGDGQDYWQRTRKEIRRHLSRYRTLPQRLQEMGYTTIGVSVNPWTENTGFDRGFDRFYNLNSETLQEYGSTAFTLLDWALRGNRVGEHVKWYNKRDWFIRWTDFYDTITDELRAVDSPYFLWVFLLDTHQPYIAPRESRTESSAVGMYYSTFRELLMDAEDVPEHVATGLERAYRDSVRSVDAFVEKLRNDTEADDPVFVVHSDHGEGFGRHGSYGHEQELYQENLHVPLLIHTGLASARIARPVSLRQLPKMVCSLPDPTTFDPGSFVADFVLSTTEDAGKVSVCNRPWKYIRTDTGREELYHLCRDSKEESNVARDHPDVANIFRPLAERHWSAQTERKLISDVIGDRSSVL